MSELQPWKKPYKRIMLVGGGNIGAGLARRLEKDYSVKLIDVISSALPNWQKSCRIRSSFW